MNGLLENTQESCDNIVMDGFFDGSFNAVSVDYEKGILELKPSQTSVINGSGMFFINNELLEKYNSFSKDSGLTTYSFNNVLDVFFDSCGNTKPFVFNDNFKITSNDNVYVNLPCLVDFDVRDLNINSKKYINLNCGEKCEISGNLKAPFIRASHLPKELVFDCDYFYCTSQVAYNNFGNKLLCDVIGKNDSSLKYTLYKMLRNFKNTKCIVFNNYFDKSHIIIFKKGLEKQFPEISNIRPLCAIHENCIGDSCNVPKWSIGISNADDKEVVEYYKEFTQFNTFDSQNIFKKPKNGTA